MEETYSIDKLSVLELNHVFKNFRLGEEHLKEILTPSQYKDLENFISITNIHQSCISTTRMEHLSNIAIMMNTIVSSVFGSWLALAGVMKFYPISPIALFFSVSIALGLS